MNIMGYMSFKNDKISLEKISTFSEDSNLQEAVERLTKLFSQDSLSHTADVKKDRKLIWHLNPISSVAKLDYIFYVLSWFGFQLIHGDSKYYKLQYSFDKNSILYLFIQINQDHCIITSHIEIGSHHHKLRNVISTSLLSELQALLKREFPHVPVYITYLSELEKVLNKKGNTQPSSIGTSKLSHNVLNHFNKALRFAISAATTVSVSRKKLINREAVISLIYEYVLKDLNLSLMYASFDDDLDRFVHNHIVKALHKTKQAYHKQTEPHKRPKVITNGFLGENEVDKKIKTKVIEGLTPKDSFFGDITQMFTSPLEEGSHQKKVMDKNLRNISSNANEKKIDKTYIESIRTYLYNFCRSTLHNILKEQYLSASLAKYRLLKEFKQFLKTVSSNSKKVYEELMATFMQEKFPLEYPEVAESMHDIPVEPTEFSFLTQLFDYKPFQFFFFCVSSIIFTTVLFVLEAFPGGSQQNLFNNPFFLFITAFLIILSLRLTCWVIASMVEYLRKLEAQSK
ncbi:hypothetical protein LCGC14_1436760 [marine sediment metagenome]|uniref:Uncharacterized protein n=1 Tax=marine sediment metagenome TaxID=412755 RepID=A0A0F9MNU8_9ZZZZ